MRPKSTSLSVVRKMMAEFADWTGLSGGRKRPRRYLWTDAFAVCNFLELYRLTGEEAYRQLALELVDQVHAVLGRHREDDLRTGWISGLEEAEGRRHPTSGGLRIGKERSEGKPTEAYDPHLEWDRDGQYYHYLIQWMHALNRTSRTTGDFTYNRWAMELAKTAHARFIHLSPSGRPKGLYWKMSIDLSYPLVRSMGHHDPLDGFITYSQLQATAARDPEKSLPDLNTEIADLAEICKGQNWTTEDPLGLGGLLTNAYKLMQLLVNENLEHTGLVEDLLEAALPGLKAFGRSHSLRLPAEYRLAFRELGLAIGLQALERLQERMEAAPDRFGPGHPLASQLEPLLRYLPLSESIEKFWLESKNRKAISWTEHREINLVMLATSLAPDGYLTL